MTVGEERVEKRCGTVDRVEAPSDRIAPDDCLLSDFELSFVSYQVQVLVTVKDCFGHVASSSRQLFSWTIFLLARTER